MSMNSPSPTDLFSAVALAAFCAHAAAVALPSFLNTSHCKQMQVCHWLLQWKLMSTQVSLLIMPTEMWYGAKCNLKPKLMKTTCLGGNATRTTNSCFIVIPVIGVTLKQMLSDAVHDAGLL